MPAASATAPPAAISQRDLYGPAVDKILATDNASGTVLWGLADYEGTIRDVVSDNTTGGLVNDGHVKFTSFGAATAPPGGRFPLRAKRRAFDPATGDYLTEKRTLRPRQRAAVKDPLGFGSGTTNFTAWAGNNAVENVDPAESAIRGPMMAWTAERPRPPRRRFPNFRTFPAGWTFTPRRMPTSTAFRWNNALTHPTTLPLSGRINTSSKSRTSN